MSAFVHRIGILAGSINSSPIEISAAKAYNIMKPSAINISAAKGYNFLRINGVQISAAKGYSIMRTI